jgi:hypothetical protein
MSHQTQIKRKYKHADCLMKALENLGVSKTMFEYHEVAQPLIDYCGRKTTYAFADTGDVRFRECDKANIIIRAKTLGGSHNDLGFYIDGDESIAFVCDFTRSTGSAIFKDDEGNPVTSDKWQALLSQQYTLEVVKKREAKKGKAVYTKKVDGKLHVFSR